MNKNKKTHEPAHANTMYLTLNGVPQLYYLFNHDEYMELQKSADNESHPAAVLSAVRPSVLETEDEYIDRDKVSKLLHVDKSTLWRWAKEGKLRYYKIGSRRVLYKTEDIRNMLNAQK